MAEPMRVTETGRGAEASPSPQTRSSNPTITLPAAPYPGLRPFEENEWPIFFGREKIVHDIVERLTSNQIVVIHGSSGCGKSSFVRAGVLARLARECAREGLSWQTSAMRPGSTPLWHLAEALAQIDDPSGAPPSIERIRGIRRQLNLGREAFALIARDLEFGDERQACILLDQFEELFRFAREIGPDEADLFAEIICGFSAAPPEGVHLIITIRSDHLGDCSQFHGLAEVVNKNQYLLPRLSDEDLIRAIRKPATLYKGEVKLDLAMRLLRESEGEVDALPLIQHSLMRMWQQVETGRKVIEAHQYQGLREGLSAHADEIVDNILRDKSLQGRKPPLEFGIELAFSALTAVDANGRFVRRPQTFGQLLEVTGLDSATLNAVLRPFRAKSSGFLMPQGDHNLRMEDIIDISHEALIRHWSKLAGSVTQPGWIQIEADDGQRYRALLEMLPGPLPLATATKWIDWWNSRPRTAVWGARYGGGFEQVQHLLNRTKMRRYGLRGAAVAGILSTFIVSYLYGLWQDYQAKQQLEVREKQAQAELTSAQNARAVSLASIGEQLLYRDGPTRALLVGLEGLKGSAAGSDVSTSQGVPIIPQTEKLVYRALQQLREKYIVPGARFSPPQVSFSPGPDRLLIGRSGGAIEFMDTATGDIVAKTQVSGLGSLVAIKWVVEEGKPIVLLSGQDQERKSVLFSLDPCPYTPANSLPGCGQGKSATGTAAAKLAEGLDSFRTVSPDGRYALSGSWGAQTTRLWDLQQRELVATLPHSFNAAFNSDGTLFALTLSDGIRVYDTKTLVYKEFTAYELRRPGWKMVALAFGPRNTPAEGKLFTATAGVARLWDLRHADSQVLDPPASGTFQAVFSPKGTAVAATLDNGAVQVWQWLLSKRIATFQLLGHTGNVTSVDFSPDGQLIATGSQDGTARVWRLRGVLAPQVTKASDSEAEVLQDREPDGRMIENIGGVLSVRNQAARDPFVSLNRVPQDWRAYGFAPDGVVAITEDGRRFSWKLFPNSAALAAFARDQVPLCNGKHLALAAWERALLLGLSDSLNQGAGQSSGSLPPNGDNPREPSCGQRSPDSQISVLE
jgi:hypothetical protein